MARAILGVCVCATLLAAGVPVSAHHSFAATFDMNKPIILKGKVTKVELINPHSWFWIEIENPDGTKTTWGFEGGSPNSLIRRGVTKNTLAVGTELTVNGYQARSGENLAVGVNITLTDGKKLFFSDAVPDARFANLPSN
ncbi:MAG: hypothetical protein A3F70_04685 [Acidobacteria bacterium RIFCSPLOWO2_12_FULL_67_14]|nr:MAG: hypothetical protein A3H29_13675 [Acidobacteria bacterium RIFCSPLOWO2_02_FULL_67_21]OFW35005.1 MAG: hypothetical protein A3F70_04685 [Acidobacteria bacterium RIFCSPLOWO2_12_FULL_67_14]